MSSKSKWASQVRKGDTIVVEVINEDGEVEKAMKKVVKAESVFGGSWFNFFVAGHTDPVTYGGREKVEVQ